MNNPILNAVVKATGKSVQVYRHKTMMVDGLYVYIDYTDCNTQYIANELKFS